MYTQALWSYSYRNLQLVGASCFSSCYFLVLPTWLSGKFKKASAWEHDWLIIRGVLKVMFTLWCCLPTSPHHLFDLSFEEPLNKFVNLISIILTSYEGVIIIIIKKTTLQHYGRGHLKDNTLHDALASAVFITIDIMKILNNLYYRIGLET